MRLWVNYGAVSIKGNPAVVPEDGKSSRIDQNSDLMLQVQSPEPHSMSYTKYLKIGKYQSRAERIIFCAFDSIPIIKITRRNAIFMHYSFRRNIIDLENNNSSSSKVLLLLYCVIISFNGTWTQVLRTKSRLLQLKPTPLVRILTRINQIMILRLLLYTCFIFL